MADLHNETSDSGAATADRERHWQAVLAALEDDSWDFRTVDGISKATGLSEEIVATLLKEHAGEVRISAVPDKWGRILYTLKNRSMGIQEILASARAFISKST